MITSMPRDSAFFANSNSRSGVRCAETIFFSYGTPKSSNTSAECFIVGQSDLLPMMIEPRGFSIFDFRFAILFSPRWASLILSQLAAHDRLKLLPRAHRAAPVDDLAAPVDDDVLWIAAEDETRHRWFRIGRLNIAERLFLQKLSHLAFGIGGHRQKDDVTLTGKPSHKFV